MVGIVVVSHSRALARAAVALAADMLHGRAVRVAVAAGLDEATFGTDAVRVKEAIEEVDEPDGVLVLMDLGSAVLSAEMALDLLEPAVAGRVRLCSAPLVEGLVAATVAAAAGASIDEVATEATAALAGKQAHLAVPDDDTPVPATTEEPAASAVFVVANEHGLHARPAAKLVAEVRTLDARVWLRNVTTNSDPVPASSLSRVAVLGALAGHRLEVTATGNQAKTAVDHVVALAARRFDETRLGRPAVAPSATVSAAASPGPLPASPGIAVGPSWTLVRPDLPIDGPTRSAHAVDPIAEWRRVAEPSPPSAARRSAPELARLARWASQKPKCSTRTSCCWTTPSYSRRCANASTVGAPHRTRGPPSSTPPVLGSTACTTSTCEPGPPTCARYETRSCTRCRVAPPPLRCATGCWSPRI